MFKWTGSHDGSENSENAAVSSNQKSSFNSKANSELNIFIGKEELRASSCDKFKETKQTHIIQKLQNRRSLSFEEKSSERELQMQRCLFFSFPAPRISEPCKVSMVYFRLQECLQNC